MFFIINFYIFHKNCIKTSLRHKNITKSLIKKKKKEKEIKVLLGSLLTKMYVDKNSKALNA